MDKLILALVATAGGILVAFAGFCESGDKWNWRKFGASALRSLFTGAGWAILFDIPGPLTWQVILVALVSGPGVDATINRVAGVVLKNPQFPLSAVKKLHRQPIHQEVNS